MIGPFDPVTALLVPFFLILVVGLLAAWTPSKRWDRLDEPDGQLPVYPGPWGGMARGFQKVADVGARQRWGTPSITTWERACRQSLERSKARRS